MDLSQLAVLAHSDHNHRLTIWEYFVAWLAAAEATLSKEVNPCCEAANGNSMEEIKIMKRIWRITPPALHNTDSVGVRAWSRFGILLKYFENFRSLFGTEGSGQGFRELFR
jgi:hypothetical protein